MNGIKSKKEIVFSYRKKIFFLIAIPIFAFWFFFNPLIRKPYNELLLITNSKTIQGYISNPEQQSEEVEQNDGRTTGQRNFFTFEYTFTLPNGRVIKSYWEENGSLSKYLDRSKNPYNIEVEYLPDNPEVSRVRGMDSPESIYEWFRYTIIIKLVVIILCIYTIFYYFRYFTKEYNNNIARHNYYLNEGKLEYKGEN